MLDEFKLIIQENLKEKSPLYEFKHGSLERSNISVNGTTTLHMDKFVMPVDKLPREPEKLSRDIAPEIILTKKKSTRKQI